VQAIRDWVLQRTAFTSNSSTSNTSAVDTLLETVGVCRDFAHLMIALCRALSIPARFATGIDYGAETAQSQDQALLAAELVLKAQKNATRPLL
jgi:transglutaminase-like putative cysteine protease